jgi:hypothetical protein
MYLPKRHNQWLFTNLHCKHFCLLLLELVIK